jgi:hypothetical protein
MFFAATLHRNVPMNRYGLEVTALAFPLWKAAVRGAAIVVLAGIHHYVIAGLDYFLGAGWKIFATGMELFTSGAFALVVGFQLYEIVLAFAPWQSNRS